MTVRLPMHTTKGMKLLRIIILRSMIRMGNHTMEEHTLMLARAKKAGKAQMPITPLLPLLLVITARREDYRLIVSTQSPLVSLRCHLCKTRQ